MSDSLTPPRQDTNPLQVVAPAGTSTHLPKLEGWKAELALVEEIAELFKSGQSGGLNWGPCGGKVTTMPA